MTGSHSARVQEFSNYEALRVTVERQELALGADYTVFFDKLAKLDVRFERSFSASVLRLLII